VAHEYVQTAMTPEQVRHLVDRAFRIATVGRTVTCLIHIRIDIQAHRTPSAKPPRDNSASQRRCSARTCCPTICLSSRIHWSSRHASSWNLMQQCDSLLMVGTSFPYAEFLPKEGQARGVQIDLDGRMLGLRYPTEVNLVGDSGATLRALAPLLHA
jgi:thiamine pyrophosphate-dependent acetolactate synthase large subunit-like protein